MYEIKYKVLLVIKQKQQDIVVPTGTIVQTCLDGIVVKYVHDLPIIICNRNQARRYLNRNIICFADSDHDYILDKIVRREKFEYERNINVEGDKE